MAQLIKRKIEASTLIEVIIAMVIIMVVFTIAIKVFNNVLSSGVSYQKIQAQNQLNVFSKEVKSSGRITAEKLQVDSVDYEFLTDTSSTPGINRLEIKASQNGKLLGIVKCCYQIKN